MWCQLHVFPPKPGHPAAHAAQSALARHDPADVPSHSQHARLRRERELWETAAKRRVSRPKSPPDDRTNARQSVAPPLRPSTQPTRAPTIMASRAVAVREHGVARHEVPCNHQDWRTLWRTPPRPLVFRPHRARSQAAVTSDAPLVLGALLRAVGQSPASCAPGPTRSAQSAPRCLRGFMHRGRAFPLSRPVLGRAISPLSAMRIACMSHWDCSDCPISPILPSGDR